MKNKNLGDLIQKIEGEQDKGRYYWARDSDKQVTLTKAQSVLGKYFTYSPGVAEEITNQASWYMWNSYTSSFLDRCQLPNIQFSALSSILNFYDDYYQKLSRLDPAIALFIIRETGSFLKNWRDWPWKDIQKLVDQLISFDLKMSPAVSLPGHQSLLDFFVDFAIKTKKNAQRCSKEFRWEETDKIFKIYGKWLELQQSDKLGFGRALLERVAPALSLPFFYLEKGELKVGEEDYKKYKKEWEKREELQLFLGGISQRIKFIKQVCDLYHKHFENISELNFPIPDLADLALNFLKKEEYDLDAILHKFDYLFRIIKTGQNCQLEEITECAELNWRLENSGYQVVKKISRFGTIKDVYLAEDNFGIRCALKRTSLTERKNELIHKKGLSPEEMLRRDLIISPFRIKHPNLCSAAPLIIGDETFILEELYDQTLEEIIKLIHSSPQFAVNGDPFGTVNSIHLDYIHSLNQLSEKSIICFPFFGILTKWLYQISLGLEECHKQGIVHADLNFTNIGIKEDLTAVLSDFGMASLEGGTRKRDESNSIYLRDVRLFQDKKRPDFESDLWAFGAICYRFCTGRFPFSEKPVAFSPEEKEKYLQTAQKLSGDGTWDKKILENVRTYFPGETEKGSFIFDGKDIIGREVEWTGSPNRNDIGQLKELILKCFGIEPYRLYSEEIFSKGPPEKIPAASEVAGDLESIYLRTQSPQQTSQFGSLSQLEKYLKSEGGIVKIKSIPLDLVIV